MADRATFFKDTGTRRDNDDRLQSLFWNRAELKKGVASLRKDQFRLKDLLKRQEGSTARIEQRLQHLEGLLLDPEWVYSVAVYYQLRALDGRCARKVARFAEELKQQREQRKHGARLAEWEAGQKKVIDTIQRRLNEHTEARLALEDQLQALRGRLQSAGGLFGVFKRRTLQAAHARLELDLVAAEAQSLSLASELDAVATREPPENQGLDLVAKRSINLMILAFAQQLYVHVADDKLTAIARDAAAKSVGAVNYGSKQECDTLLETIRRRAQSVERIGDFADALQKRTRLLATHAEFRRETDAVPASRSVGVVYAIDANGRVTEYERNLLGDNYWGLSSVLSG